MAGLVLKMPFKKTINKIINKKACRSTFNNKIAKIDLWL